MTDNILVKVILFTDASVHFCIPTKKHLRTFYATAASVRYFMSNPLGFLENDDGLESECESTQDILGSNERTYPPFEKAPGVGLCYLTGSKELVCKFPELFQVMFNSLNNKQQDERINMRSFIFSEGLSDAKTFLLRYYLAFVDEYAGGQLRAKEFSVSHEAFFSILREIFNTVFSFKEIEPPKKDLEARIGAIQYKQAYEDPATDSNDNMISVTEYCALYGIKDRRVVYKQLNNGSIANFEKRGIKFYIDKDEKPLLPDDINVEETKSNNIDLNDILPPENEDLWTAEQVANYIKKNRLYSSIIGRLIYTKRELDIYLEHQFRETEHRNHRFLIIPFDPDLRDENGVTNRERMLGGNPPVTLDPDNPSAPPKAVEMHHIGQQDAFATIPYYLHKKHSSIFHYSEPSKDNHDSYFASVKKTFWEYYIKEAEKDGAFNFDNIDYFYPIHRKSKNSGR